MLNPKHPITRYLASRASSVGDLAHLIGRSEATVYRWIGGSRTPNAKALVALEKVSRGALTASEIVGFYLLHKHHNATRKAK